MGGVHLGAGTADAVRARAGLHRFSHRVRADAAGVVAADVDIGVVKKQTTAW